MIQVDNKEIQATISAIVYRLVSSFDIEKIVLFGSYVTGKHTRDSDIDLFVLSNGGVRHVWRGQAWDYGI